MPTENPEPQFSGWTPVRRREFYEIEPEPSPWDDKRQWGGGLHPRTPRFRLGRIDTQVEHASFFALSEGSEAKKRLGIAISRGFKTAGSGEAAEAGARALRRGDRKGSRLDQATARP